MAQLRGTVFVKFWGNRDPPELSRLLRGKANDPTKFWGNRVPPELSRLLRGKANDPTKFWGHRDPLELSRVLFGTVLPNKRLNFGGPPRANRLTKDSRSRRHRGLAPGARRELPFRPYLHARIPRITVVEQLPQINDDDDETNDDIIASSLYQY